MADKHDSTDRDAFGHWLSGFTDGEGCFGLYWRNRRISTSPRAIFQIALRSDDIDALISIRDYFNAGLVYARTYPTSRSKNEMPASVLSINKISALENIIIPHFTRYPLRTKKARDFVIWKEAVMILATVTRRRWKQRNHLFTPKYTSDDLKRYAELRDQLRAVRQYKSSVEKLPPQNIHKPTDSQQFFHFDQ